MGSGTVVYAIAGSPLGAYVGFALFRIVFRADAVAIVERRKVA